MELLGFSPEILSIIVGFCKPAVIETCRTLADIAFSTPSFWTSVNLGSSQFVPDGRECLRKRLVRALDLPLKISIGWVDGEEFELEGIVKDLCLVISERNAQINRIDVYTTTPKGAEIIIRTIFNNLTPSAVFSALRSLTIGLDYDYGEKSEESEFMLLYENEFLYVTLSRLHENFPFLEFLSISSYGIPSFGTNKTFSHLRTLILNGKDDEDLTDICTITELLSNTPQLETLWMKHDCIDMEESALNPVQNWEEYNEKRPMRIFLPHLVRLVVSAPGTGTDLLHYLEAPSLEYLHLDGRCSFVGNWYESQSVIAGLKSAASRLPGLRHLALTLLPMVDFETLLFGDEGRLPFPKLETLALHKYPKDLGPNEAILTRLAQEGPKIPLRRLVLRRYKSSFPGQILIQMFQKAIENVPNEKYELEVDYPCAQITKEEFNMLEEMGVKLFRRRKREAKINKWWTLDALNDGSDLKVY